MNCIVCNGNEVSFFLKIKEKKYWKCSICSSKFLDKKHYLDPSSEKKRYLEHNNNIDDMAYRNFLTKLLEPLENKISKNDQGLEFGCGYGPALADMLSSKGYKIELYDPFFFPNKKLLENKYDFITCTETVEHFFDPYKEFNLLDNLLAHKAWLGIMTCFLTEEHKFENWYYRKDPTHVVFYAEKTFKIIAEQRNWSCEIPNKDIALFCKN